MAKLSYDSALEFPPNVEPYMKALADLLPAEDSFRFYHPMLIDEEGEPIFDANGNISTDINQIEVSVRHVIGGRAVLLRTVMPVEFLSDMDEKEWLQFMERGIDASAARLATGSK